MKKKLAKLSLNRETLRMCQVAGGVRPFPTSYVDGCPSTPAQCPSGLEICPL